MNQLNIETSRLNVRNLRDDDLWDFYLYRSDPQVTKYQGFEIMSMQECEDFIASQTERTFGVAGEWVQYGIEDKNNTRLVGDCAIKLDLHDARISEIGITIAPVNQQRGYAKECLSAILTFLFDHAGILRVVETVDADNLASVKLLESIGFKKEGYFIENIFFKGRWGSEYQYAMLKREWDARSRSSSKN